MYYTLLNLQFSAKTTTPLSNYRLVQKTMAQLGLYYTLVNLQVSAKTGG